MNRTAPAAARRITVGLVTPSFQHGRWIEATVRSVLDQSEPPEQYLVMDGGSGDETVSVLERLGASGRFQWISEKDRGQSHAINKGMALLRTDVMGWLNSDDMLFPDTLRQVRDAFARLGRPGLVFAGGVDIDADGNRVADYDVPPDAGLEVVRRSFRLLQPATFWSREVWEACGPVAEDLHYCMDLDFFSRAFEAFPSLYVPGRWALNRVYPERKSGTGGARRLREMARWRAGRFGTFEPGALQLWLRATVGEMDERLAARRAPAPLRKALRWSLGEKVPAAFARLTGTPYFG
jgi:glycosyltransferase involved in cell wall biosynthesis